MKREGAARLAADLGLVLDDLPVCLACLSFVSFAVRGGDEAEIRRETNAMARDIWDDGLATPARMALERAARDGVPDGQEALEEVAAHGGRSAIAKAIVRRLGEDLAAQEAARREKRGGLPVD